MSLLLSDCWWQVAQEVGGFALEGTATTASTTTTIVDTTNLPAYANDYLNEGWAYILMDSGGAHAAPEGQTRLISDFVGSSGTITVGTAFSAAVQADTYRVWVGVPKAELLEAVKAAFRGAHPSYFQRYTDETTLLVASTFEYSVPSGIENVAEVWVQGDSGQTFWLPLKDWILVKSGASTRKLVLDRGTIITAGYYLRLIGTGPLDIPANDYTAVTIEAEYEDALREFVGLYGAGWLHQRMMGRDVENRSYHLTMMQDLMKRARAQRGKGPPQPAGRLSLDLPAYWS